MSQKNGTPVDTENGHDGEEQAAETKTASNQAASSDVTGTEVSFNYLLLFHCIL